MSACARLGGLFRVCGDRIATLQITRRISGGDPASEGMAKTAVRFQAGWVF